MALVRRHDCLLLRLRTVVLLLACLSSAVPLRAQSGAPGAAPGVAPLPAANAPAPLPQERVLDIRISGNRAITREKVLANIGTKIDRPFDQATFDSDVRKLVGKNWFVNVVPQRQHVAGGVIITLEVIERPTLESVTYLGNKKIKHLAKTTGLKKGDSLDPFAVEEGARKIETLYQTKGFNDVKVTVLEGNKPSDRRAVYLINEGKAQKVKKVLFVGNTIASDSRLKTQIQTKPPILGLLKGYVDRKKIEDDVEKLTDYYRGLGFFRAVVGRDYQYNENEDRMTLTFYVNEGPRYQVNKIGFIGNKIYDEEVLQAGLKLHPGDYFDRTKMNADIGYVKDLYGSNGYVFADAQADLQFDLEPGELDLLYQVTEGKQCLVGDINVHIGGDNPHTRTVTAINRLGLRPGDVIDIRKIRSSERRIKSSGLFNVDPTKGDVPKIVLSPPDSEEGALAKKKKKGVAGRTGNPDSFRGQSPDAWPPASNTAPAAQPPTQRLAQPRPQPPAQLPPQPLAQPLAQSPTQSFAQSSIQPAGQWAPDWVRNPLPPAQPVARFQSPDAYGGYGGQAVNPISPGPQPYTVNQPPGGYTTQPPIIGAPPPGTIYQPGYAPPGGYAPGNAPPGPVIPGGTGISPELIAPPDDRPQIPLDIYLTEAQTGRFMFGAGVNSNAGLVGSIIIDEQNFDWRRFPTSWEDFRSGRAFRGAGQKFRIEAAPGTQVSRYMFNFAEPYLLDTPVSFGLSGYYFNRFYRDWTEQRAGGRTSLGYQFSPDLSGSLAFRAEDIRISQPRVLGVPALDEVLGYTQLYSFKGQVAWDTRDSTFLPTEGHYISLDFEYALGSFQFPRYGVDFRKYWMLRERPDGSGRHVLSLYNNFGITGSNTPIYERYFAGGFSTLRGFQFRGASPQVNTVEVGGDFQNLSSVEYMFPVTADDMLRAVVFVDFGTVEPGVKIDWDDFRVAPGFGLRISLPALGPAPIALDLAFPVAYAPTDIRQLFSFFVGYSR